MHRQAGVQSRRGDVVSGRPDDHEHPEQDGQGRQHCHHQGHRLLDGQEEEHGLFRHEEGQDHQQVQVDLHQAPDPAGQGHCRWLRRRERTPEQQDPVHGEVVTHGYARRRGPSGVPLSSPASSIVMAGPTSEEPRKAGMQEWVCQIPLSAFLPRLLSRTARADLAGICQEPP